MKTQYLFSSDNHEICVYTQGKKTSAPLLFFHGGPGSGFKKEYLHFFSELDVFFISFDQRGTGKSHPQGSTNKNTLLDIMKDADMIMKNLGIGQALIAGHSWGAHVAINFARQYPERVRGLFISSYFAGTQDAQLACYQSAETHAANAFSEFKKIVGCKDNTHLSMQAYRFITSAKNSEETKKEMVFWFQSFMAKLSSISPKPISISDINRDKIMGAKIFFYYAANAFFEDQVVKLPQEPITVPGFALHGTFDKDTTIDNLHSLNDKLPKLELHEALGGHNLFETPMNDEYRKLLLQFI